MSRGDSASIALARPLMSAHGRQYFDTSARLVKALFRHPPNPRRARHLARPGLSLLTGLLTGTSP